MLCAARLGGQITTWDAVVRTWLGLYKAWGHMTEGGVTTLVYDTECCHVQGECEWDVCADTIVSRLVGGRMAAGIYVGSDRHAAVPRDLWPRYPDESSHPNPTAARAATAPTEPKPAAEPEPELAVVVFAAWPVRHANLTIGSRSDAVLNVTTSSVAPNQTVTLHRGMVDLEPVCVRTIGTKKCQSSK